MTQRAALGLQNQDGTIGGYRHMAGTMHEGATIVLDGEDDNAIANTPTTMFEEEPMCSDDV